VDQTSDGGYITVSKTVDVNNYNQILRIKTNSMGIKVWENKFGGLSNDDIPHEVHQTSDNGYIIAGYTDSYGAGLDDVWLIKTFADGNIQWERKFGGDNEDQSYSVQIATEGDVVAGMTRSNGAPTGK
jgi:hypothetical protein